MEICLHHIEVHDKFWSFYQELIRDVVLPYQEKILKDEIDIAEKSGAVRNLRIAAGEEDGKFYGQIFQDSDVAKWLEAVSYISYMPEWYACACCPPNLARLIASKKNLFEFKCS